MAASPTEIRVNDNTFNNLDSLIKFMLTNKRLTIRKIKVTNTKISLNDCKRLSNILKKQNSVSEICLSNCQINDNGFHILLNAFRVNSNGTVSNFDFSNNQLSDIAINYLVKFLQAKDLFKNINLQSNSITDRGAEFLTTFIKNKVADKKRCGRQLESIDLRNNRLSSYSSCAIYGDVSLNYSDAPSSKMRLRG